MASEFPGSPMVLKGALVVFGAPVPVPTNLIVFQYNPDEMRRTFRQAAPAGDEADRAPLRRHAARPAAGRDASPSPSSSTRPTSSRRRTRSRSPRACTPRSPRSSCCSTPTSTIVILNKALALAGIVG